MIKHVISRLGESQNDWAILATSNLRILPNNTPTRYEGGYKTRKLDQKTQITQMKMKFEVAELNNICVFNNLPLQNETY